MACNWKLGVMLGLNIFCKFSITSFLFFNDPALEMYRTGKASFSSSGMPVFKNMRFAVHELGSFS